jgi:N-acetylmuramoyl-L-alanine amidase
MSPPATEPFPVLRRPSPNHGERRDGLRPTLIVLHYTAMPDAEAALERLCDPVFEVSAHWLIGRDGRLWSLVEEERRAWHAGAGQWGGVGDVNSRSIGIEVDNDGRTPFTAPAIATLERLLPEVMARWDLRPEAVIGHSDMAPGRKADPGPRFDWLRLARSGLSVWPRVPPISDSSTVPDPGQFLAHARAFGWPVDLGLDPVLTALRLRFRPGATGPLQPQDAAIAAALATGFPVDRGGTSA